MEYTSKVGQKGKSVGVTANREMGGNLRLCSNTQKATPHRGGIQNSPSEKEWAVERDMEKQKVHQKDKARILVLQDRLYFSFIFYEVSRNQVSSLLTPIHLSFFTVTKICLLASMGSRKQ